MGFLSKPPVEEQDQGEPNLNSIAEIFNHANDFFDPKGEDIDSFLDFEAINWLESHPNTEFGFFERDMEVISEVSKEETESGNEVISFKSEPIVIEPESIRFPETIADDKELKRTESSTLSIEKEMGKVSLIAESDSVAKGEPKSDSESESESDSESESESSSSSSASSDSSSSSEDESEEEDEEKKGKTESKEKIIAKQVNDVASDCEEGEIKSVDAEENAEEEEDDDDDDDDDVDDMVDWSDFGASSNGPIKSKNELTDLPPVPQVDVTLEPHHNLLPVGVVMSMMSNQVIVEGAEKHNPLSEGSILWITETRSPLGIVDEIFGPVKSPYYIVRYNSENEVPAGIQQGSRISFVVEFADYVLNSKELYKKGYDASGDNDEEIAEEFEFSDDEKEAEHRRMQKMVKRGASDQNPRNMKNNRRKMMNKDGGRQMGRNPNRKNENGAFQPPQPPQRSDHNQRNVLPPTAPASGHGNFQASPVTGQNYSGGNGPVPQAFQQMSRPDAFAPHGRPAMPWNNQPNTYSNPMANPMLMQNRMPMPMQNQMPVSNPMLFQPQFGRGQFPFPNMVMPNGQGGFFCQPQLAGQTSFNQPAFGGQNSFNQPAFGGQNSFNQPAFGGQNSFNQPAFGGMGFRVPPPNVPQGSNADNSHNSAVSSEAPPQPFSMGAAHSGRGRTQDHRGRGRGRFGRGRGRQQSR